MPYRIEFLSGPRRVPPYRLRSSWRAVLGRSPQSHVLVAEDAVSRLHCEIRVVQDLCTVRDLGSANGTFVNGKRVTRTVLDAGDVLRIGRTTIRLARDLDNDMLDTTVMPTVAPARPSRTRHESAKAFVRWACAMPVE